MTDQARRRDVMRRRSDVPPIVRVDLRQSGTRHATGSEPREAGPVDAPKAAAGWYPDPKMVNTQRYWDGEKWTDHAVPASPPMNPQWLPVARPDRTGLFVGGLVTAVLLPIVGFIIGIVLIAKDEQKGWVCMVVAVVAFVFWLNALQPDPAPTYNYYP